MSRRGNCHDNAVAESFPVVETRTDKEKIYATREEARSDIFDYIEMFYNSKRRHGSSDQMSPTEYENQYYQRLEVSRLSVAIQSQPFAHPALGINRIRNKDGQRHPDKGERHHLIRTRHLAVKHHRQQEHQRRANVLEEAQRGGADALPRR